MNRNMLLTAILAALLANLAITVTNTVITGRAEAQNGPLSKIDFDGTAREQMAQLVDDMHKMLNLMDQMNDRVAGSITQAEALAPKMNTQFQLMGGQFVKMNQTLDQILAELRKSPRSSSAELQQALRTDAPALEPAAP